MSAEIDPIDLLVSRLADHGPGGAAENLVLAAALGDDDLRNELAGQPTVSPPAVISTTDEAGQDEIFLREISVEGFRGVADKARLGLRPHPGLTIITGRNGSGKSSFAEAAELALTGKASRWERRSKVWEEGWACLHHKSERSIELKLSCSGQAGDTVVRRKWQSAGGLSDGQSTVQTQGGKESPSDLSEWRAALATWRPFLSYNELGGLLDEGPSRLYDALSVVLGLEEWTAATERLDASRKQLDTASANAKKEAGRLLGLVKGLDDERAQIAVSGFGKSNRWNLDLLEKVVAGLGLDTGDTSTLEALTRLPSVDSAVSDGMAKRIRLAANALDDLRGSDAERASHLAALLDDALSYRHRHCPENAVCPVCGTTGVLDDDWVVATTLEVERLRSEARAASFAKGELTDALVAVKSMVKAVPEVVDHDVAGVDCEVVRQLWAAWASLPDDPAGLADHITSLTPPLSEAIEVLKARASTELESRQDAWLPVAAQISAWIGQARASQQGTGDSEALKQAAVWLRNETANTRNERLRPVSDQMTDIWQTLCSDSNVSVTDVALAGKGTIRHVEVNVEVDAVKGAALSVMSQGELHALALAMFLPRATTEASPWRFVLIDDPVQAMDFVRVDGLARVLDHVAENRQVIVFTHDARLPTACRRLGIAATILEVTRTERSQVTVRRRSTPAEDMLDDVGAILATKEMPDDVRRRVVPGLCRRSLEAVCADLTWRRLLHKGRPHSEIEELLDAAGKLMPRLALALFGEAEKSGEVLSSLNKRCGSWAADCVQELNRGSHTGSDGDLRNVAERTKDLIGRLESLD